MIRYDKSEDGESDVFIVIIYDHLIQLRQLRQLRPWDVWSGVIRALAA